MKLFVKVRYTSLITLADVDAFWFSCSKNLLNYLAFQSFDFGLALWWLLQKRVVHTELLTLGLPYDGYSRNVSCTLNYWLWACLMMVITETCRAHWIIDFGLALWWLFQKRVVHTELLTLGLPYDGYYRNVSCTLNYWLWACLMMVIPETCRAHWIIDFGLALWWLLQKRVMHTELLTLGLPYDGYYRNVSCTLNYWLWACLVMVIPETCRAHWIIDFGLALWWLLQKRVVHTELLTLGLPYDGYYRNMSCTLNYWLWACLMMVIPETCRAHWIIDFGLALWWLFQKRVVHTELLTLGLPYDGYSRNVSCTLNYWLWACLMMVITETCRAHWIIDFGLALWWLLQKRVVHTELLTLGLPYDGYYRNVSCTLNYWLWACLVMVIPETCRAHWIIDFGLALWWLFQKRVMHTELLTLGLPYDGYYRNVSCTLNYWLWACLVMVIPETCRAHWIIDFGLALWWLLQKHVVHTELLTLGLPYDGYYRHVWCTLNYWLWACLVMVIPETCRAHWIIDFGLALWWLLQKRVVHTELLTLGLPYDGYYRNMSCTLNYWLWACLMMVIPETCRAHWIIDFGLALWWLFQKRVVHTELLTLGLPYDGYYRNMSCTLNYWLWACLMMVITDTCGAHWIIDFGLALWWLFQKRVVHTELLTLGLPYDGYYRNVSCTLNYWLWACLMMVITETCRAHWIIDFGLALWWLLQTRVVHTELLTLGLPCDGYSRNVSCTLNYWLWACLMMVITETCRAHWIIDFGLALWWLLQKRVVHTELLTLGLPYDGYSRNVSCTLNYWLWACLMMVIPETCRAHWIIDFGLALWWLLQKRVVHTELLTLGLPYDGYYRHVWCTLNYWLWACLMMVIPETCGAHWIIDFGLALWWLLQKRVMHTELLTLGLPYDGYSRNVSCTLNYWLWACLMMVITETCRAHWIIDFGLALWWLFQKRVVHTELLTLGLPYDGYYRNMSCTLNYWLWACLMMVIPETCRAHWIIDFGLALWWLFQKRVVHTELLTLGLPYDGYYRNVSCTLNYWLWACLMMVITDTCGAHWIIDFGLALWWLFQKRVVHTELLTLGLPYDGYYRNVSCTLNYWLWACLMMVITETCRAHWIIDFGLALWWLLQTRVVHTELLTLGLPYDGYSRNVWCTLNYWLWACLMMVITETCRAHWIIDFGLALWWLFQKRVVHTELLTLGLPCDGYYRNVWCTLNYWLWACLMMVIPETCRAHWIIDFGLALWWLLPETCRAHWIIDFGLALWWLLQKRVVHTELLTLGLPYDGYSRNVSCTLNYWLWACLMMVITETCRAHWIIDFGLALWWLLQKRVVHTELLTLGLPYDGYYRNVSCTLNYWLWACLMMVIPETCRAHWIIDFGLALWWLFQKRVVHTELLTLGLPYDGYSRNMSCTLNYWLWACLMMVITETCRAHWIIDFGLALWWLFQERVVHTELLTLGLPYDGYYRNMSCTLNYWLWACLMMVITETCRAHWIIDFGLALWWLLQKRVVHTELLTLGLPYDGYSRNVSCTLNYWLWACLMMVITETCRAHWIIDFGLALWWLLQKHVVHTELLTLGLPYDGYYRNVSCTLN